MAAGEVKKLTLVYNDEDQEYQNSLYLRFRNDLGTVDDLVNDARTWKDTWLEGLSESLSLVSYRVEDVVPGTAIRKSYPPGTSASDNHGTVAGNADAVMVAALVSWRSQYRGQGNRGRWFVPGLPDSAYSRGQITVDFQTALALGASTILLHYNPIPSVGNVGSARYELVLWRRHLTGLPAGFEATHSEPYQNEIRDHVNHKPVYLYPPKTRPPFSPLAAIPIVDVAVPRLLRAQRRRELGVHITRAHRV
jgi:hypothetical protein